MPSAPDLSEFDAAANRQGPTCTVALALAELTPERRASLLAALSTDRYQHTQIAKVVSGWGVRLANGAVSRHRRRICSCE